MDAHESTTHTTLGRSWVIKNGLFVAALLFFGAYGTVDALIFYPRRGLGDASYQFRNFLAAADAAGKLTESTLTISDPKSALRELEAKENELRSTAKGEGPAARDAALNVAKLEYLSSLDRAWQLNASPKPLGDVTTPEASKLVYEPAIGKGVRIVKGGARTELSPRALGERLDEYWKANKPPTPLSGFDMPFQYLFMAVGFLGGLWLLISMLRAAATAKKITWDPAAKRLGLPGGASVTPDEIADIDKRDWHKYFCTIVTKSGASHRLDLLRYDPLESWVLELEKIVFPDRAKASAEADKSESAAATGDAGSTPAP